MGIGVWGKELLSKMDIICVGFSGKVGKRKRVGNWVRVACMEGGKGIFRGKYRDNGIRSGNVMRFLVWSGVEIFWGRGGYGGKIDPCGKE